MNENSNTRYHLIHLNTCETLSNIFQQYYNNENDEYIRRKIYTTYWSMRLDPDSKVVRYKDGIKCTADGLHSIKRICDLEKDVKDIIPVYMYFRSIPIFFFPSERGGINPTRFLTFGNRIDHTLYDLKLSYTDEMKNCRLYNTYNRPKTKRWLENMKSFEHIVDWWGVKGIFTDEYYNVYNLEYNDNRFINQYLSSDKYREQWSSNYYNNLKEKTHLYINKLQRKY